MDVISHDAMQCIMVECRVYVRFVTGMILVVQDKVSVRIFAAVVAQPNSSQTQITLVGVVTYKHMQEKRLEDLVQWM
jgi:hypothetical protein